MVCIVHRQIENNHLINIFVCPIIIIICFSNYLVKGCLLIVDNRLGGCGWWLDGWMDPQKKKAKTITIIIRYYKRFFSSSP